MPVNSILHVSLLLAIAAALPAQRTWTVDANNGVGTDFTDLPPAVTAAADGDTIRIRPGAYSGVATGKALAFRGTASGVTVAQLNIWGLGAGKEAVIADLDVILPFSFDANAGRAHLQNVGNGPSPLALRGGFNDCRQVTADRCRLLPMHFERSSVLLTNCTVQTTPWSWPGLELRDACATIAASDIAGSDENCSGITVPPGPGLRANRSQVVVTGASRLRAGAPVCGGSSTALTAWNSQVTLDPSVVLVPTGGSPPIDGDSPITMAAVPAVVSAGVDASNRLLLDTSAPTGSLMLLLGSAATLEVPTVFGSWWIAPANIALDAGVIGATGNRRFALPLGGLPPGVVGAFQAVVINGGPIVLSTPVVVPLD